MSTDKSAQMNTDKTRDGYLYEKLTYQIISCLYAVQNSLGSNHKESAYHKALEFEFQDREIPFTTETSLPVIYKDKRVGSYRPDFIVDDTVILEIKVAPHITKAMQSQVYYYVKGTRFKLVLLANFGTPKVTIKRLIYTI